MLNINFWITSFTNTQDFYSQASGNLYKSTSNIIYVLLFLGMQITLPAPDGQNQIITGPYQIKMQLAHNSSPPIQGKGLNEWNIVEHSK